jgi:hypothetical protein
MDNGPAVSQQVAGAISGEQSVAEALQNSQGRTFRRRLNTTPGDHRHQFRGDIFGSHP